MSSHVIVIARIGLEDPAQVRLAEHNEVIKGFSTNRFDKPLDRVEVDCQS